MESAACPQDALFNQSGDTRLQEVCVSLTLNLLVKRCPLAQNTAASQASWACDLCSHTGPRTWKDPVLDLMFCCHHFEILDNLCTRGYMFAFCSGPCKWWWPPLCWGRGIRVLLDFTTKKRQASGLSVLWNTFSGFSETVSSFQLSIVPLGLAAGCSLAALSYLWCSFPAHVRGFHNSKWGSPPPGPNLLFLLWTRPADFSDFDRLEPSLSLEHDMLLTSALFLLPIMLFYHCHPLSLWLLFF